MKNIKRIILFLCIVSLAGSCTKNFEQLNTNPNAVVSPDINNYFTFAIALANGRQNENYFTVLQLTEPFIQHFASLDAWIGDKYLYSDLTSAAYWRLYVSPVGSGAIKELTQIIALTQKDPNLINKRNAARILRVYSMHRITDLYGDVPYFDAGAALTKGVLKPKYDKQQDIYADMLKELDESASQMDTSKPFYGNADVLYNGDISKWKKFAYSLMLRLAMRLTKVDPAMAKTWATKAIAGGVFQTNDDMAVLKHEEGPISVNQNPIGSMLLTNGVRNGDNAESKLSNTFVDFLKNNNDPRLRIVAMKQNSMDNNPADQKGLPNGYNVTTITSYPGWTNLADFSDANTLTVARRSAPDIFLSTAEVNFLLAEASLRGWYTGDPQTLYNNAVTDAMSMMNLYANGTPVAPISSLEITLYLAAHPFNNSGTFDEKMQQIHTQFWASLFLNGVEAFSNWRRTGYPILTPIVYPGNASNGSIPRRIRYPSDEQVLNGPNYNSAVSRQGPDEYTTRVWWDKQ